MIKLDSFIQDKYLVFAEQALTSLLSFGAVFILSKLTSIPVFADFVLTYSYASFVFIFISYFISGPVLVFLPKKWKDNLYTYILLLLVFSIVGTVFLSFLSYLFLSIQVSNITFLGLLGLNLGMVISDLFKKTIFASKIVSFKVTVVASIFMVLSFFGIMLIYNDLNLKSILYIYCISYFGAIIILALPVIKARKTFNSAIDLSGNFKVILKDHYVYSRWIIAGGILFWVYSQGIFILADALGASDKSLGMVRSIQNLLGIFTILIASMESYYIPKFAQKTAELKMIVKEFYLRHKWLLLLVFALSLPVVSVIYHFMYEEKYGDGLWIILIIWISQIITVYLRPYSMALKAREITYPLFYAHIIAAIVLFTLGVLVIKCFEEIGMATAILLSFLSSNLVLIHYYRKYIYNTKDV